MRQWNFGLWMPAGAEITEWKPYETYRSGVDTNQWKRAPFLNEARSEEFQIKICS